MITALKVADRCSCGAELQEKIMTIRLPSTLLALCAVGLLSANPGLLFARDAIETVVVTPQFSSKVRATNSRSKRVDVRDFSATVRIHSKSKTSVHSGNAAKRRK
jgi:hypothetical protein